jgi:hypothetical protein
MHYSPIIAPVLALILWKQVAWFTGIPAVVQAVNARPPLTTEQWQTHLAERLPWNARVEPFDFYLVCIALALMNAGRGLDCWLAWAFATCWVTQNLTPSKSKFNFRTRILSAFPLYALTLHTAFQITRDLLSTYG